MHKILHDKSYLDESQIRSSDNLTLFSKKRVQYKPVTQSNPSSNITILHRFVSRPVTVIQESSTKQRNYLCNSSSQFENSSLTKDISPQIGQQNSDNISLNLEQEECLFLQNSQIIPKTEQSVFKGQNLTTDSNDGGDHSTHHTNEEIQTKIEISHEENDHKKAEQSANQKKEKRKYTRNPNRVYKNYQGKIYYCNNKECKFETLNRTSYYNHIKHSHQTDTEYNCDQCQYKSTNKRNLNQHIAYCHIDTVLSCEQCGKQNLNKYSLKKHIKEVHCEKSYRCEICYRQAKNEFFNNNNQNQNEKIYEKLFKSKSSLNKHILNVHSNGQYNCQYCKYHTKCQQYLKEHIRHKHNYDDDNNINKDKSNQLSCIVLH
ncbi:hypothetical protein PPERSA_08010 [Pseudocohnilembus persalinus]|uniref:C2H2-type domain-containing protein n=1 Tax=Pseudocohnilembus persalinus TaxID=266149 RepID=A0A0V0R2J8_PSEPJ|nr:hypothetical protein PPERSA_08010 [Pseudocohnilembus persalinus]|eukprot:KRX08699.1 hypothetical protein PPERSA_08010 [Pseudocohnilembus persalinus]